MQKALKYVIFKTKWGYFGLAGTEYALCRTCLPGPSPEKIKSHLLKSLLLQHRASLVRRLVRRPVLRSISEGGSASEVGSFSEGGSIKFDKAFFKQIQQQIIAYFEGVRVDFGFDVSVSLDGFSDFQKAVLATCRSVRFGQTTTYGELAKKLSRPAAARAVGNALSKNPLPLLIPCHRVVRSDGFLGGFSAPGGKDTKVRLLRHEKATLDTFKNG